MKSRTEYVLCFDLLKRTFRASQCLGDGFLARSVAAVALLTLELAATVARQGCHHPWFTRLRYRSRGGYKTLPGEASHCYGGY